MKKLLILPVALLSVAACTTSEPISYVDPFIGSDCAGSVTVGPCMPFGFAKPGPDCDPVFPSGYLPIKNPVEGFSQTHVSGTDDPAKYGNVLVMPFIDGEEEEAHYAMRCNEEARIGYYGCTLGNGVEAEMTAGERVSLYRFTYPGNADIHGIEVDAGHCISLSEKKRLGYWQWTVDGKAEWNPENPCVVTGFNTVDGGWGTPEAYTVYYYIETSVPATGCINTDKGVNLLFDEGKILMKVGISMLSVETAMANASTVGFDFEKVENNVRKAWNKILSKVKIPRDTPDYVKKMFYTGIYHTMIMPTRRTGDWKKAGPDEAYYDDYMTLWDTYRSAMPLTLLLDPDRTADIINGMITIWKHEKFMPDGRAGDHNVAVQGSTNADVVIADAFFKGVSGVDYEEAFQAMLQDAYGETDNWGEGRTGITDFINLGYVPSDKYIRAGSRTTDYSYSDWLIAKLADSLGHKDEAAKLFARAENWRNIWDTTATLDGIKGFMVPRTAAGEFADSIMRLRIPRTFASVREGSDKAPFQGQILEPLFYEANSVESSLCVPHDIDGLIELCGGPDAFYARLEHAFDNGLIDAGNEPSFLSSCLYHWVGRPDRSYDRIRTLMDGFFPGPCGIPGNDDSGGMSSWYVFHCLGLYPNAGQPYYLLHTPAFRKSVIRLPNGRTLTIKANGLSRTNRVIQSATLNGKPYPYSTITHETMMEGGVLEYKMGETVEDWGQKMFAQ